MWLAALLPAGGYGSPRCSPMSLFRATMALTTRVSFSEWTDSLSLSSQPFRDEAGGSIGGTAPCERVSIAGAMRGGARSCRMCELRFSAGLGESAPPAERAHDRRDS
jgi:hypothetical protein